MKDIDTLAELLVWRPLRGYAAAWLIIMFPGLLWLDQPALTLVDEEDLLDD